MSPFATLLARLLLATVWLTAGFSKLAQDGQSRSEAIEDFHVLPRSAAQMFGIMLPWIELSLGALLLIGMWLPYAAGVSAVLLVLFSLAISINLLKGRDVECNCFGQLGQARISWAAVARNVALLAAALWILLVPSDYFSVDGWKAGVGLRAGHPPIIDFVPVLLLLGAGLLAWALGAAAWAVAGLVARADDGPAVSLPERQHLRRWLGLSATEGETASER
jgi:uncharacterized membrane protein YphA (DoxX/SURF4 family)